MWNIFAIDNVALSILKWAFLWRLLFLIFHSLMQKTKSIHKKCYHLKKETLNYLFKYVAFHLKGWHFCQWQCLSVYIKMGLSFKVISHLSSFKAKDEHIDKNGIAIKEWNALNNLFIQMGISFEKDYIFAIGNVAASISQWAFLSKLFLMFHRLRQNTSWWTKNLLLKRSKYVKQFIQTCTHFILKNMTFLLLTMFQCLFQNGLFFQSYLSCLILGGERWASWRMCHCLKEANTLNNFFKYVGISFG